MAAWKLSIIESCFFSLHLFRILKVLTMMENRFFYLKIMAYTDVAFRYTLMYRHQLHGIHISEDRFPLLSGQQALLEA